MFEVLDGLDGRGLADALDANHRATVGRQAFELLLVAGWADVHNEDSVPTDAAGRVLPGMETARAYGGDGTPLVAEFATAELAPLLGVSPVSADNLLRDALDLRHRHPLLWARIEATAALAASPVPAVTGHPVATVDPGSGELVDLATELGLEGIEPVLVWQARKIAQACHTAGLTLAQAQWVDAVTSPLLGQLTWGRFGTTLGAAIIEVDPAAAQARARADALRQHVTLGRSDEHGLLSLVVKAKAGDLVVAKAFIDRLADILALDGDPDPAHVRQATAAGILLGNPYRAVTLLLNHATQPDGHPETSGPGCSGAGGEQTDQTGETGQTGQAGGRDSQPAMGSGVLELWARRRIDPAEVLHDPGRWPVPPADQPPVPEPPFPDPLVDYQDRCDDGPPEGVPADADPADPPPRRSEDARASARPPQPDTGDPWCGLPPPLGASTPATDEVLPFDSVRQRDVHPCADDADDPCPTCAGTGHATPSGPPPEAELIAALADAIRAGNLKPDKLVPPATLYVHLSAHALWHAQHADGDRCPHCAAGEPVPAVARVEGRIGPSLLDQARQWLGHRRVALKPVIDLNTNHAVECYEVPAWLTEVLDLCNPGSVWPYSANTSRAKDTDHTMPYQPEDTADGEPGQAEKPEREPQTRIDNLGRLERRTHRVKTFGRGWQHHQPQRGVHLWRSPHGHWYRVDHNGTHRLGPHPDLSQYGITEQPEAGKPEPGDGKPDTGTAPAA